MTIINLLEKLTKGQYIILVFFIAVIPIYLIFHNILPEVYNPNDAGAIIIASAMWINLSLYKIFFDLLN
jgi:hypothetical protein